MQQQLEMVLKTKGMVSAEGIESARERNSNDLQRSRWHVLPCFRCKAVRTARKWHGKERVGFAHSLASRLGQRIRPKTQTERR
jgi:hypothetical protein